MNKIDCVEEYFAGIRAYYLFQVGIFQNKVEYLDFILDKRCINGAKLAFISNIMLGIKEDLVDTKGAMDYRSKVFLNALENSVGFVATKVENGYKIGNYVFPDAPTLVAIVRNKLAHGKYKIDFEHNRVILEHKGVDIVININKLASFVVMAFQNAMRDVKSSTYERNIVFLQKKTDKLERKKIKDISGIKKIIKSFNCYKFKVESTNGLIVYPKFIDIFEKFLDIFKVNPYAVMQSDVYKNIIRYFKDNDYEILVEYSKLKDDNIIDKISKYIASEILGNDDLTYEQQIQFIGLEVQRNLDDCIDELNIISANTHNLVLLDAIRKTNSVNRDILSDYIGNRMDMEVRFGYDEYGLILIGMFNSLFMYPFDDIFETSGEYKIDRENSFDFSDLDLSMFKPDIINIDDSPLNNCLERCNSLLKKQADVSQKLSIQQKNLLNVKGNSVAESKINASINDLNKSLSLLITEYMKADSEYNAILNDFTVNRLHFENRTIIEGIRNSIAHGNFEFNITENFYDTEIVFNDIFEGKNTFSVCISFEKFEEFIDKNYDVVLNYVRNKINGVSKKYSN